MGFLGKLVGGTIGFALGGPLGAVAGAVFGHSFDKTGDFDDELLMGPGYGTQGHAQLIFFVGAFSMLAKLARSDGKLSHLEVDAVERFMSVDLSLDPESRRVARGIFDKALESGETFQDYALQFYRQFRGEPQLLKMMIDIMLRVSVSDGGLTPAEDLLIGDAVRLFQIPDTVYSNLKARYQGNSLGKYYQVLNAREDDDDEQIKSRYRKLVAEYHPDKIASKGLPEAFTQFAHDKFREIQEAYEKIKAQRGMR